MNINTSTQFSASYGSVSYTTRPIDGGTLSFDNALNITDSLEIRKSTWEDLVGLKTTDEVAEDGTITRTMTGGTNFLGAARGGSTLFSVSLQKLGASFPVKDEPASGLYSLRELEAAAARVCRGFSIRT